MSKITELKHKPNKDGDVSQDRVWVYVDGKYCCSMRERTSKAMELFEGKEAICSDLIKSEKFFWKNQYKDSWDKEKVRIEKVSQLIKSFSEQFRLEKTGFGADSNELIEEHPDEPGAPDVSVFNRNNKLIMYLEVTGTEYMRNPDKPIYWIRPDKIQYCQSHPEKNIWIILHFAKPSQKFVFVKINPLKTYRYEVENIKGADEHYSPFSDADTEVKTMDEFRQHLISLTTD
jgi:hypothetical protein